MNRIFLFSLALLMLQSCQSDNSRIYSRFENELNDSIGKNNAKKFDYQYDGLTPQSSYFVNTKLRFMTLRTAGESSVREEIIYFDTQTDSISKHIERYLEYEWDETGNNVDRDSYSDTIYVINYKQKKVETFVKNEMVNEVKAKEKLTQDISYILDVKKYTEKNYNDKE